MRRLMVAVVLMGSMLGQTTGAKLHKLSKPDTAGIDTIIELVQGGAAESVVIKTLRDERKVYRLLPADVLRLQKAGVSENIINVMMDPKAPVLPPTSKTSGTSPATSAATPPQTTAAKDPIPGGAGPTPAPVPPADAGVATPYPADLQIAPVVRKHRVVVEPFNYAAIREWFQYHYHTDENVGPGIRAMLISRLQQSKSIIVLERSNIEEEQNRSLSAQVKPGTGPLKGRILGADGILTGDLTIAGRDDKGKHKGIIGAGVLPKVFAGGGGVGINENDNKAVVNLELRVADAETSEVVLTASARGESSRKDKGVKLGGVGIGGGGLGAGGASNGTNSTNFADTIMGEAIQDAVNKIAQEVEERISQVALRPRKIEGRVATLSPAGTYLALGGNDGLLLGDRFEILEVKNEVLDPQTKEQIDVEAVKVGELVVREVHDHAAIGNYGGQPLSSEQLKGKGYQARLMSK